MKNKIIAFLTACLILLNCTPVFAGANTFVDSETMDETVMEREDYILQSTNSLLQIEGENTISSSEIDYNKIVRKFIVSNLFEGEGIDRSRMKEYTENQELIYLLPVHCNDVTALSTLKIRQPVTDDVEALFSEEDLKDLQEEVGKWYISVQGMRPGNIDYKNTVEKILEKNNIENSDVYFVGGICSCISLAAVICNDNPDDTRVLVLEQYGAETGTLEEAYDYQILLDKDTLYTYDEIKAIVEKDIEAWQNTPDNAIGGVNAPVQSTSEPAAVHSKIIIISVVSCVAVLAIAVAAFCIVKKKKKEQMNNL